MIEAEKGYEYALMQQRVVLARKKAAKLFASSTHMNDDEFERHRTEIEDAAEEYRVNAAQLREADAGIAIMKQG